MPASSAPPPPSSLEGRRILLGITGGIAAFKAPYLVRRLRERGASVRCAMTEAAESFVAPLTLEVLSEHAVYRTEWLESNGSGAELHMTAAQWADAICVAPCTAHTLARLALGLSDDFLSTTALAFGGPLVVAPAMHSAMWRADATQGNLATLRARGVTILGPVEGALASGELGPGRMLEPEEIVDGLESLFEPGPLSGRTIVIDAGPTHEPVDPVRFLGNRSSGKTGFAIAAEAAARGARVILVSGPVALETPPGVERIDVVTALEMRDAVYEHAKHADLVICAAAVADFRPRSPAEQKVKKEAAGDAPTIQLERNPDILAGLAAVAPEALRVGFAAETERLLEHARAKLEAKDVDFVVANDVSQPGLGFGSDDNHLVVLDRAGDTHDLGRRSKRELAAALLDLLAPALAARPASVSERR
jgi:phosphopantothenoylcysteine decarboxylase/phosphopantothenate--cysteine ligase